MKSSFCVLLAVLALGPKSSEGCCPVTSRGSVVNADQTVIILWDPATKMQHFIRQASFKSDGGKVGFIIPSPSKPELAESGDEAFTKLEHITAPVVRGRGGGCSIGCSARPETYNSTVTVLERKRVAGFDAVVLKAGSAGALTAWLGDNGYPFSDDTAAWAEPYIRQGWPLTALKVAETSEKDEALHASAFRMSFKTERPLFPYREPDSASDAKAVGANNRLLRIYFISDKAYAGAFDGGKWNGNIAWSGDVTHEKDDLLRALKLPADSGTDTWWLTEFEDQWAYAKAPGDVFFTVSKNQRSKRRKPVVAGGGGDVTFIAFALFAIGRTFRRTRQ